MRLSLSLFALATFAAPAFAADKPNIVVMMTDDQRHDYLSCAGHPFLKTPNIDRIAKEGFRYTNAFVTNALCAPSRATLMTGQYSHLNGVRDNMGTKLNPDAPWLPDELRKLGYEVAFCGKSHVPGHFRDKTWDYYFGFCWCSRCRRGNGSAARRTGAGQLPEARHRGERRGWENRSG